MHAFCYILPLANSAVQCIHLFSSSSHSILVVLFLVVRNFFICLCPSGLACETRDDASDGLSGDGGRVLGAEAKDRSATHSIHSIGWE